MTSEQIYSKFVPLVLKYSTGEVCSHACDMLSCGEEMHKTLTYPDSQINDMYSTFFTVKNIVGVEPTTHKV